MENTAVKPTGQFPAHGLQRGRAPGRHRIALRCPTPAARHAGGSALGHLPPSQVNRLRKGDRCAGRGHVVDHRARDLAVIRPATQRPLWQGLPGREAHFRCRESRRSWPCRVTGSAHNADHERTAQCSRPIAAGHWTDLRCAVTRNGSSPGIPWPPALCATASSGSPRTPREAQGYPGRIHDFHPAPGPIGHHSGCHAGVVGHLRVLRGAQRMHRGPGHRGLSLIHLETCTSPARKRHRGNPRRFSATLQPTGRILIARPHRSAVWPPNPRGETARNRAIASTPWREPASRNVSAPWPWPRAFPSPCCLEPRRRRSFRRPRRWAPPAPPDTQSWCRTVRAPQPAEAAAAAQMA